MIAAQMIVFGAGMGLAQAPATEAIMGAVPKHKAGVGSAVNDATRLFGGTLGVAVAATDPQHASTPGRQNVQAL